MSFKKGRGRELLGALFLFLQEPAPAIVAFLEGRLVLFLPCSCSSCLTTSHPFVADPLRFSSSAARGCDIDEVEEGPS